ncbi:MAG TPA: hypothetical protein VLQ80_31070 [Candidatus Saccharimonadia bacterium]|nr:hypothetical protein [Candidatus Saccharimonadia bacterium]
MIPIFSLRHVRNPRCLKDIVTHLLDGCVWPDQRQAIRFPSLGPYGFHMRGGSGSRFAGGLLLGLLALAAHQEAWQRGRITRDIGACPFPTWQRKGDKMARALVRLGGSPSLRAHFR